MKRTDLRTDPAKVREWQERSRQRARERDRGRRPLASSELVPIPVRQLKNPPPQAPASARQAARARSGGRCIVCLFEGRTGSTTKAVHLHHVLPKGLARFSRWAADSRNLVGLCELHHARHTDAAMVRQPDGSLVDGRVPWEALPDVTVQFIAQAGGQAVDYAATWYPRVWREVAA